MNIYICINNKLKFMKNLCLALFIIVSVGIYAQESNTKFIINYDDCILENYITKADKVPEFMGGVEELKNYFTDNCSKKPLLATLEGKLFIHVLIDSSGKACCRQIANKTGEDISELELQRVINEMPVWQAAVDEGKKVNFSAFLILNFSEGNCIVTYNRSIKQAEKKEYDIPYYSIDDALKYIDRVKTLNLSNKELKELDPAVGKLVFVKDLNLSQNQLKSLPKEIGQLINLEFLYLSGNQIEALPKQIGEMSNLKGLLLNKNQLKTLPKEIGKLKNLRMLNVSVNKIPQKEIEKIKSLLPECHIIY